jgi:hypothetical protein
MATRRYTLIDFSEQISDCKACIADRVWIKLSAAFAYRSCLCALVCRGSCCLWLCPFGWLAGYGLRYGLMEDSAVGGHLR